MTVEVIGALIVGLIAANFALLSFGGDSVIELMSGMVVLLHIKGERSGFSGLGEDASRLSSLLLFALIPVIAAGAVYTYFSGIRPETSPLGVIIAAGAITVMPFLWLEKRRIGKETNCVPLRIDAVQSATCFLMSIVLFTGLIAEFILRSYWIDYVATAIILSFVAKEAVESYNETGNGSTDG
jgi:divalent metal cation (Fe/Co/Zn/Cd) transporter